MTKHLKERYFQFGWLLILPFDFCTQTLDKKFETFSIEDGLFFENVYSIAQDSVGFLWFATKHGLNRYDGFQLKQYLNNPSDLQGLSNYQIWFIFVDRSGILWACTSNGLNKYDSGLLGFTHFYHDIDKPNSLPSNSIKYIDQDTAGNYLILKTNLR